MEINTQSPIQLFFKMKPEAKALFDVLVVEVLARFPETSIKIHPTQIALISVKPFCAVWCPQKSLPNGSQATLIISVGLDHQLHDQRIYEVNQPYPNRWMHHVLIEGPQDIDETVLDWLSQAREFSMNKRKRTLNEQ